MALKGSLLDWLVHFSALFAGAFIGMYVYDWMVRR